MASLSNNLAIWAYGNDARIAQLQEWQTLALEQIIANGGQQVIQTSGNGVSVTLAQGMSYASWFNTLTEALAIVNSGTLPPKKKQAIFPCDC